MKYINRELSWLSFNERVLQEAMDERNPIIERVRFLGIYSNNMDEFFRVRVATVKRLIAIGGKKVAGFDGTFDELLTEMMTIVKRQQKRFEVTYQRILIELEKNHIQHIHEQQLSEDQRTLLNAFFQEKLEDQIVPILLNNKRAVSQLKDSMIYLAVTMVSPKKSLYALIEIPSTVERFYVLKEGAEQQVILIDDIIRINLDRLFHIFEYDSISAYTFKFTRDAELDIEDDLSISLIEKMKRGVKNRKDGEPVRFVYDEDMPSDLFEFLVKKLKIDEDEIIEGGKYHNFKDFIGFPDFGRSDFVYPHYKPVIHPELEYCRSILETIIEKDILLHYPYQNFTYVVDLLREAALDPKVNSIKINLYRVAKNSQVINALINAIKNDKKVTVIMELQARFDEENNMYWARVLEDYGAHVIYGVTGLKVHSKLFIIERKNDFIAHIGTGNFHEKSARIYTDFSLLTSEKSIVKEVNKVFTLFENNLDRSEYRKLLVSPFNTRETFIDCIDIEIENARDGIDSFIIVKLNNLIDKALIEKLYEASNEGVKIDLIIRGMCGLVPGIKGQSENITVRSLVGRFLEHSRVAIFCNGGDEKVYISSADWMSRNLDKRVEVSAPILDKSLKIEIMKLIEFQLRDNCKTRIIDSLQKNEYFDNGKKPFNAQEETYRYFIDKAKQVN